ncbi:hypothetical protein KIF53_19590 [Chromobacterium subtsugae]|uniref:Uncharacterized protein n=1 Tax=Chromobacterium subtsugae TaxID=251747 RepID=A0ABS7FIE8_9NEIS|nr:hypothetical protein [Chromobacterium subtsugae]MBW7569208.1 hypothetical protein [Chromobacterium subtsugae]MBW8289845.1 hypothetical protein [Chromobacterium subtsugae]WSE90322.1 hypothetical protein U6115_15685 [Chromobacterium subtsugae]WVH58694.1 hypothetical protein U6151_15710 [Chromobacterium subtsugae]
MAIDIPACDGHSVSSLYSKTGYKIAWGYSMFCRQSKPSKKKPLAGI